jgi:hypothetical protein
MRRFSTDIGMSITESDRELTKINDAFRIAYLTLRTGRAAIFDTGALWDVRSRLQELTDSTAPVWARRDLAASTQGGYQDYPKQLVAKVPQESAQNTEIVDDQLRISAFVTERLEQGLELLDMLESKTAGDRPIWNRKNRTLAFNGVTVAFEKEAPECFKILDDFQTANWPRPPDRINVVLNRQNIYTLNKKLKEEKFPLHFDAAGRWHAGNKPKKKPKKHLASNR